MSERTNRLLTWTVAVVLVALIATVWYLAANPAITNPAHTEFYLLGDDGNASDYPSTLEPGEITEVTVGIANHEHRDVTYRIAVRWNETLTGDRIVSVPNGETREFPVLLTAPDRSGPYQVRFQLHKGASGAQETLADPDLTTHLVVRVQ